MQLTIDAPGTRTLAGGVGEALFPRAARVQGESWAGVPKGHDVDFDFDFKKKGKPMTPATEHSYRLLAAHFYATNLSGKTPTANRISEALTGLAGRYRPDYWRRLRNALAFDQRSKGFEASADIINATKNPLTRNGPSASVPARQSRTKRVNGADEAKLLGHFREAGDLQSYAAIVLAKVTGARPAEFASMTVDGNLVTIHGAKKSEDGIRGADRVIRVNDEQARSVAGALRRLEGLPIGPIQDRIRAAGKKLWPQRKSVPSLYSWRHQLGSDLKASGMSREQIAFVMGHQATASVDKYGNRKMGNGQKPLPQVPEGTDLSAIRSNHTLPPASPGAELAVPMSPAEKISGPQAGSEKPANGTSHSQKSQKRQGVAKGPDLNM